MSEFMTEWGLLFKLGSEQKWVGSSQVENGAGVSVLRIDGTAYMKVLEMPERELVIFEAIPKDWKPRGKENGGTRWDGGLRTCLIF